jgi:hypothetical protein
MLRILGPVPSILEDDAPSVSIVTPPPEKGKSRGSHFGNSSFSVAGFDRSFRYRK